MRHPFNPDEERGFLTASWGIVASLQKPIEEVRVNAAVGHYASSMLSEAIRCFLVGIFLEGRQLIEKARQWLQLAIAEQEILLRYGKYACEASRFADLFQCNWLLNKVHDCESGSEAIRFWDLWFAEHPNRKQDVILLSSLYIDAEAYQEFVSLFDSTRGLKPPHDPQNATGEAQVCYVIAKQRSGQDYMDVDLDRLLERFLKKNVSELLGNSRWSDAARWMKIAHWRAGNDPIYTLLRCYDYLPGLAPPDPSPYRP